MKAQLLRRKKVQLVDELIDLQAKYEKQSARIEAIEHQHKLLLRMVFGQKGERFISVTPPGQLALELGLVDAVDQQQEQHSKEVSFTVKRNTQPKKKPVRQPLPEDLPRKTTVIEPDLDLEGAVKIGEEVSEWLEVRQAEFYVRRIVRPKYVWPAREDKGVAIAELPSRPVNRSIAGASLLALIIINKYVDHLPLYRQIQRFKRLGVKIAGSTISDWISHSCGLLEPLYDLMVLLALECAYLQVDETRMKVLDRARAGPKAKIHLGWQWIYQDPLRGLVIFDYQKGRDSSGPNKLLKNFKGFLQTDGYVVYDAYETKGYPDIIAVGCMAHARRYFEQALKNDPKRAEQALFLIAKLYRIERVAREKKLTHAQRKKLRQDKARPVLDKLKTWLDQNLLETLPKSPIGEAVSYSLGRWKKLCAYSLDGRLEIDNNLAENSIRPIALGRKNYLFAGSHDAARRTAMLYSFMATCKRQGVNPAEWLGDVLERIKEHPVNRLEELLPDKWKTLNKKHHAGI